MNKKEYVDRGALLAEYKRLLNKLAYLKDTFTYRAIQLFVARLENEPAADVVEVRHGEWLDSSGDIVCSNCKTVYSDEIRFMNRNFKGEPLLYCPNCNAKMDGGKQDG